MTEERFASVLKFVSIITFRYTVSSKLHTNLKEDIYNKSAIAISQNPEIILTNIALLLKPLYPMIRSLRIVLHLSLYQPKEVQNLLDICYSA